MGNVIDFKYVREANDGAIECFCGDQNEPRMTCTFRAGGSAPLDPTEGIIEAFVSGSFDRRKHPEIVRRGDTNMRRHTFDATERRRSVRWITSRNHPDHCVFG